MEPLLEQFRDEVCLPAKTNKLDDLDWYALSVGFFLARGASLEKALSLAVEARYDYLYWHP